MCEAWTTGWLGRGGHVVAVEGDVDVAERDRLADQLGDQVAQRAGEHGAAAVDPDDREPLPPVFSTISCAMRTSVRRMSSPSRTTFSLTSLLPGLSGPG